MGTRNPAWLQKRSFVWNSASPAFYDFPRNQAFDVVVIQQNVFCSHVEAYPLVVIASSRTEISHIAFFYYYYYYFATFSVARLCSVEGFVNHEL
jgi:hypothetical protein